MLPKITKKEAKIEALRIATALCLGGVDFEDCTKQYTELVQAELTKLGESLYKKAVKAGGSFNKYTGYEFDKTPKQ